MFDRMISLNSARRAIGRSLPSGPAAHSALARPNIALVSVGPRAARPPIA